MGNQQAKPTTTDTGSPACAATPAAGPPPPVPVQYHPSSAERDGADAPPAARTAWRFTTPHPMAVPDPLRRPDGLTDHSAALLRMLGLGELAMAVYLPLRRPQSVPNGCWQLGALAYVGSCWPAAPSDGWHHTAFAVAAVVGNVYVLQKQGRRLNWCGAAVAWRCVALPASAAIAFHGYGSRHGHGSDVDYVHGRATVPTPPPQGLYVG